MIVNKKLACFTGLLALSGALLASCTGGNADLEFKVKFESNGGSAVATQTVKFGQKASKPADPTKDNAVFDGWFADKALKVSFDFSQEITADWTVYAKWNESVVPETSSQEPTSSLPSESEPISTWTMTFIDASWWNEAEASTGYTLEPASDGKGPVSTLGTTYDTDKGYDSVKKINYWHVTVPEDATKIQFFRLGKNGTDDWGARTVVIDLSARNGKTTWALDNVASWFSQGKQATGNWVE